MDRLADFRRVFAQAVASKAGCSIPAVIDAFAAVPRHEFLGPGPWYFSEYGVATPTADPAVTYQDTSIGISSSLAIPTGLPSLHARCIAACQPMPGESVVHVGCGTGYFTAILAHLVGPSGAVAAYEVVEALAEAAQRNLRPWPVVTVVHGSGASTIAGGVNLIYVNAGVTQLPLSWLQCLADGGRLLFPLVGGNATGYLCLVRKVGTSDSYSFEFIMPARFVPCLGTEDAVLGARLTDAFADGRHHLVKSLRLGSPSTEEEVWLSAAGWYLSYAPASMAHGRDG